MASIEEALVAVLGGSVEVTAIAGTRFYPSFIPEETARPALSYLRISHDERMVHAGWSGKSMTRLQLTMEGITYAQAKALSGAVRRALRGYRGTAATVAIDHTFIENDQDGTAEIEAMPVVRTDVLFLHDGD